ncbi:MAG TPA: hypothetical protein VN181_08975 [Thermoanaerobaculia bacterium]|nr:hypothetical protein [Thermoanaerobaculia bacterium]
MRQYQTRAGRLTFDDICAVLDANRGLRAEVIAYLAHDHTPEFVKAVEVVPRATKGAAKGKK